MGSFRHSDAVRNDSEPAFAAEPSSGVSAEDVFLAWLLWLPEGVDVAVAASVEIERLDRAAPLSPRAARLRELMLQVAGQQRSPRMG